MRIKLLLILAGIACAAQAAEFNYVPAQQVVYWTPPVDYGQVSKGWEPPSGYEKTSRPWAPPKGWEAPTETWQPPKGWGALQEWSPPEEFKGKVIRQEIH